METDLCRVLNTYQSVRGRFLEEPFAPPFCPALTDAKYSSDSWVSALMVLDPSVQFAGQTSPCLSYITASLGFRYASISRTVNWNALSKRIVSSTERPTGRSLTVICLGNDVNSDFPRRKDANLRVPLGSIMNKPRKAIPASSSKTPYSREICIFLSAMRGRARSGPRPPCFLGCEAQAK